MVKKNRLRVAINIGIVCGTKTLVQSNILRTVTFAVF